jgi:hypothetical protein
LENNAAILAYISEKNKAIHGDIEAADFVERHSSVIAPLAIVSSGTRRVTGSGADVRRAAERGRKNGAQGGVLGLWNGVEGRV